MIYLFAVYFSILIANVVSLQYGEHGKFLKTKCYAMLAADQ